MGNVLTRPRQPSQDAGAPGDRHEWPTIAILAISAILGFGGGLLGAEVLSEASWQVVAIRVASVAVGVMLAVTLLRIVDVLSLRKTISREIRLSRERSARIRARMEEAYPGVSARARDIDANQLLDEALAKFAQQRR